MLQQTQSQSWDAQYCNVGCNNTVGWAAQGIEVVLRKKGFDSKQEAAGYMPSLTCMLLRVRLLC